MRAMDECPRSSDTIFGPTFFSSNREAVVCLKSWKRISGRFAYFRFVIKVPDQITGRDGGADILGKYQPHGSLPDNLKSIPLVDVVGQYVDLRPVASGYIGLCPFHPDTVPSFGINTQGNFWHCFAGCGGGDLAHFYAKLKNLTYTQAVEELKHGRDTHHS